jgi:hypothetical protein
VRRSQVIITCDRCGKGEAFDTGYGSNFTYGKVAMEIDLPSQKYSEYKSYELCPDCLAELGIINEEKKVIENQDTKEPSVAEKLYNVICEIVADNIEQ